MKILFVCTGNTCRSIMAEGIAKFLLNQVEDRPEIEFHSAGLAAFPGSPSSNNAQKVMMESDIDITQHKASQLNINQIESADLILTMTEGHKEAIYGYFGVNNDKVFTLKEYANESDLDMDICDPYGGSIEIYRTCAQDIRILIAKVLDKIASSH